MRVIRASDIDHRISRPRGFSGAIALCIAALAAVGLIDTAGEMCIRDSAEVEALFALPFMDLIVEAQRVHRQFHAPNTVQISTCLLYTSRCV